MSCTLFLTQHRCVLTPWTGLEDEFIRKIHCNLKKAHCAQLNEFIFKTSTTKQLTCNVFCSWMRKNDRDLSVSMWTKTCWFKTCANCYSVFNISWWCYQISFIVDVININLSHPDLAWKEKEKLNFYFRTSLKALKVFMKPFVALQKSVKISPPKFLSSSFE